MARTKTISDKRILEVARAVFVEQGPSATTAEIARRAGISEGSIFRRWDTKSDLLMAALDWPDALPWVSLLEDRAGQGDLRQNLETIALAIIDFLTEMIPVHIVKLSCGFDPGHVWDNHPDPPPLKGVRALIHFFDQERRLGRISNCDPEIVARMLLAAVHFYAFAEVSHLNDRMPMAATSYVRGVVDVLLKGVATSSEDAP
jgi:AcrR family transcriptional regulator